MEGVRDVSKNFSNNQSQRVPLNLTSSEYPDDWFVHILSYLKLSEIQNLLSSSRQFSQVPKEWKGFFRFLAKTSANQFNLFCPEMILSSKGVENDQWKMMFREIFKRRKLWRPKKRGYSFQTEWESQAEKVKVKVYVRFKPNFVEKENSQEAVDDFVNEEKVDGCNATNEVKTNSKNSMPLHQKLLMLKAQNKEITTSDSAFKLLWTAQKHSSKESFIDLVGDEMISEVKAYNEDASSVTFLSRTNGLRMFFFDGVFSENESQQSIYDALCSDSLFYCLNGSNATLLAYGQTGSGKTHTIFGKQSLGVEGVPVLSRRFETLGLLPRLCLDLLQRKRFIEKVSCGKKSLDVFIQCVEIFGDNMMDLVNCTPIKFYSKLASKLSETLNELTTAEELFRLLDTVNENKKTAETKMNTTSSRAHSVFILNLVQTLSYNVSKDSMPKTITTAKKEIRKCNSVTVVSKLYLCDLGGSEHLKVSGATNGDRMKEAININLGLLALKKVVAALSENKEHIPYKESKLTSILSHGLGGNSETKVIICASLDPDHAQDTLQSLRFGEMCSSVENRLKSKQVVENISNKLEEINHRIEQLLKEIEAKERWEEREVTRVDPRAENDAERLEIIKTSVLVGAEEEHKELSRLYQEKANLFTNMK